MSLLDFLGDGPDDPRFNASLALAQGLMNRRGAGGLLDGLMGYQNTMAAAKKAKQQEEMQAMQQRVQMLQFEQAQRQAAAQEAAAKRAAQDEEVLRRLFAPVTGTTANAATGLTGPTPQAASAIGAIPKFDPRAAMGMGLSLDGLGSAIKINEALNPAPKLMAVAKGSNVIDERTGKQVFAGAPDYNDLVIPGPDGKPTLNQLLFGAKRTLAQDGRNVQSVHVHAEKAFEIERAKANAAILDGINKAALSSGSSLSRLARMEQLLQGVDGGKLAPMGLEVASAANTFGIKMDPKLGNKEAAEALAREMAGNLRVPGTGPMTDKDFDNFLLQVPSLSKSAEGRAMITQTLRAAAIRDQKLYQLAQSYMKKNRTLDDGFIDVATQFFAENPVVPFNALGGDGQTRVLSITPKGG